MRTRILLFFMALFIFFSSNAQTQFSGWLASFNTFFLNKKLSLHFDAQLRSTDDVAGVQTVLFRPGLNVHLSKRVVLSGGYAYIANRRTLSNVTSLLPEHRLWQQAIVNQKISNISIAHRLRFEERFLSIAKIANNELQADGYNQAFRLRYFLRSIVPFSNGASFSKGLFFALQNEIFLNTGNKSAVNGKSFDQNRLYTAIGFRLPAKLDLEAGYMNQYTVTRTWFTNNHIVQLAAYKRL
ncbi:MAG TPA: DUF2490 domain-containing protein [Flavisolibacter sp.]|jgi:hypothetical protein|nr:DUF2490 domain-containing protein [Flavisolibacter sp.]